MESVEQLKFVPVEGGTTLSNIHGTCPKCGLDFKGPDVREHMLGEIRTMERFATYDEEQLREIATVIAADYGWTEQQPKHFSHIMGVALPGAEENLIMYQCPKCSTCWDKFTGKEGDYEIDNEELPQADAAETPTEEPTDERTDN